jgi:hypothetical protein
VKNSIIRGKLMSTLTQLTPEQLQAAQIMQSQPAFVAMQSPMGTPAPLDPSLDPLVEAPYQGLGAVGSTLGGAGLGALAGFLGKGAAEKFIPSLVSTSKVDAKTLKEMQKEVLKITDKDLVGLTKAEISTFKEAQEFLNKGKNGEQVLSKLQALSDSLQNGIQQTIVNASDKVGQGLSELSSFLPIVDTQKMIDLKNEMLKINNYHGLGANAIYEIDAIKHTLKNTKNITPERIQEELQILANVLEREGIDLANHSHPFLKKLAPLLEQPMAVAQEVENAVAPFLHEAQHTLQSAAKRMDVAETIEKAMEAVSNKAKPAGRPKLNGTAQNIAKVAVAGAVVYGAYQGYKHYRDAKDQHDQLQAATQGTREHYAGLYNEATQMANTIGAVEQAYAAPAMSREEAAMRAMLEQAYNAQSAAPAMPSAAAQPPIPTIIDVPYTVVNDTQPQGKGVELKAPTNASSLAERQSYERAMAAQGPSNPVRG